MAGDTGWDGDSLREGLSEGSSRLNCTHHGVNPGTLSSFEDVTMMVGDGSAAALQTYMEAAEYGADGHAAGPRVWAAVVFEKIPGAGGPGEAGDWEYRSAPRNGTEEMIQSCLILPTSHLFGCATSVRVNFTHADTTTTERPFVGGSHPWSYTYYSDIYTLDGFLSLQVSATDTPPFAFVCSTACVAETHRRCLALPPPLCQRLTPFPCGALRAGGSCWSTVTC